MPQEVHVIIIIKRFYPSYISHSFSFIRHQTVCQSLTPSASAVILDRKSGDHQSLTINLPEAMKSCTKHCGNPTVVEIFCSGLMYLAA